MATVQKAGFEEAVKNSPYVSKSKADMVRFANIMDKVEKGEKPVYETLELVADKVSDKKRAVLISLVSLGIAAATCKNYGQKIMPYAKKAVKGFLNLIPEKGPKYIQKISNFINKELNTVSKPKIVKSASGVLSKLNVNKVGDVLEWGGAGLAAFVLGKAANKTADKIDDELDIKKLNSQEEE